MEFKEDRHWLYAMTAPEGEEIWCRADFESISLYQSLKVSESFCDKNGKITKDLQAAIVILSAKKIKP